MSSFTATRSTCVRRPRPKQLENRGRRVVFHLTGFGKFHGVQDNPTSWLMRYMPVNISQKAQEGGGAQEDVQVASYTVLDVSAEGSTQQLDIIQDSGTLACEGGVTVYIHCGVDAGAKNFRLEQRAYNECDFRVPDEKGYQPRHTKVVQDDPATHRDTKLPLDEIYTGLGQRGWFSAIRVSTDPGRFVCNHTYFMSLAHCDDPCNLGGEKHALFVHVPPFDVISRDEQVAFLQDCISVISQQLIARMSGTASAQSAVEQQHTPLRTMSPSPPLLAKSPSPSPPRRRADLEETYAGDICPASRGERSRRAASLSKMEEDQEEEAADEVAPSCAIVDVIERMDDVPPLELPAEIQDGAVEGPSSCPIVDMLERMHVSGENGVWPADDEHYTQQQQQHQQRPSKMECAKSPLDEMLDKPWDSHSSPNPQDDLDYTFAGQQQQVQEGALPLPSQEQEERLALVLLTRTDVFYPAEVVASEALSVIDDDLVHQRDPTLVNKWKKGGAEMVILGCSNGLDQMRQVGEIGHQRGLPVSVSRSSRGELVFVSLGPAPMEILDDVTRDLPLVIEAA